MESKRKRFWATAVWMALALVIAIIVFGAKNDSSGGRRPGPSAREAATQATSAIDFTLPLYTKRSALVCPLDVIFDRREGHGLQGAVDAHLSVFGHDDAIEKSGCVEWRDGISVLLTDEGKTQAMEFEGRQMCGMVAFGEGLIFSCDLRNAVGAESEPKIPEEASLQNEKSTPPPDVTRMMAIEDNLNDECRGGSGDNPETAKACDQREAVLAEIKSKNWCWGHDGQVGSERAWQKCEGP